jgi:hypothetical protein
MSEKKPIIGITLLLSKPKAIDLQGVTQAAEFAFHGAPEKPKVMQMPGKPAFGIALGPLRLVVINVGQAYFTEVGKVANRLSSVSARDAVQSHKAWLSVDATGVSPLPEELLIPTLGLLAAEFCDDTVLGLMRLPKGPVVGYDFSFISLLRNRKALEMFKNGPPDRVVRASVEISDFLEAAAGEAPYGQMLANEHQRGVEYLSTFRETFRHGQHHGAGHFIGEHPRKSGTMRVLLVSTLEGKKLRR